MYYKKYGEDILVLVEIANDRLDGAGMKFARIDPKTCGIKWAVSLPTFESAFPTVKNGIAYFSGGAASGTVDLTTGKWKKQFAGQAQH